MNNIIKQIEVDVYSPTFYEVIKAQQGDKNSRFVEFILFNQGDPYTIPDNVIVKLEGSRPNKSPVIKPDTIENNIITIKNNVITVELDEDLLYYAGISHLKIVLYDTSDHSVLSTIPFTLSVQKNPLNSDKFEKDNYSLLNQLILQTETVNQNLEKHISDNDDPHTIIYEEPDTISKLTVGEKLSDTFGKLSRAVSDLISHINNNIHHITSEERENWNDSYNKRHVHPNKDLLDNITASYTTEEKNKLSGIQDGAEINIQSDWNISDSDSDAYIRNKPSVYTKNEIDNKFSALETNIDWKESVDTFDDIATVHQNPQDGWTVNVKDTDYTYRYNGTEWIPISANAIPKATNSVDGLLSKEDHSSYDDANSKKHSHSNKSVLDKVTQILLDSWNAAKTHADSAHAPSNAEANQNAFSNILVGSATVAADSKTDTLTLASGSNVTITPDTANDKITISSSHPSIPKSNSSTSTAAPSAGGTFTAIDSITSDSNGHVIKINTKTVTIPKTSITVDSSLSSSSTNPVQNKVINSALSNKASTSHNHDNTYLKLTGGTVSGDTTINAKLNVKSGFELFGTTPYIDFHYNNSTADNTARIIQRNDTTLDIDNIAQLVLNGAYVQTTGNTGWHNKTWDGGWYMMDNVWVRTYNSKSIYAGTGVVRGDGGLIAHGFSGSGQIIMSNANAGNSTIFRDDGSNFYILFGSEAAFNALRPFCINKSSGHITIGTSVDISGNITINGLITSNYNITARTTAASNCYIDTLGHIFKTSTTSSRKFKDDITTRLIDVLNPDKLYDLPVVQFKYKKDYFTTKEDIRYRKDMIGFIAEDIYEIYPIAADYHYDESGDVVIDGWNDKYIIPAMLKLIQEQKKEIDLLKKSVSNLSI